MSDDGAPGNDGARDAAEASAGGPSLDRSKADFVDLAADAEKPVVVRASASLDADVTPLGAYATLVGEGPYGFLLESGEKVASSDPDGAFTSGGKADRHARYSFVGYDPEAIVSVHPDRTEVTELGPAAEFLGDGTDGDGIDDDAGTETTTPGLGPETGDAVDRVRAAFPDASLRGFPDTDRQILSGGFVGFLAYEAVYDLWLEEVGVERPETEFPDAEFALTTRTVVFDEREGSVELVFTPVIGTDDDPAAVYEDLAAEAERVAAELREAAPPDPDGVRVREESADPREEYEEAVRTAKQHVLDGDIYQGVISRSRELRGEVDSLGLYAALRDVNPSPYMYVLRHDDRTVVGASPETLVSVKGDRVVSNPIAGTCPRGTSPVEDRRLAGEMLADGKERAEHTMLVDLARNDVRRVSEPGSVRVEEFMNVLKYSHVQHIESTVTGTLAADADAFDATRATFPAGTLTGAPKVRAMEIIDDLETTPREAYGGGVGYYSWTGDADFAIVIRTATLDESGAESVVGVRAGAGLVADSDPAAEYEETEQKMDGVLTAIDRIREDSESDGADEDGGDADPLAAGSEADR
ncbi:anthranilate synthase component I [Halorubrum californiense DSM 19288]|uniref:Anthranilate synthase component 1 n=1 Tax=Halorubrum californiense DSM 19288 TaxID=1227465 RepID=M0DXV7_9EURY|nr:MULTISPECIES: anthranilate synthase component I [Halorubrum]ELZ40341.1 anthranilate synthase component I [Halorubrum californiense DSM 19288]TKX73343.1 anthranilate synthase component I [Halorubrum sp. GN11GM_10-3_MGM]